MASRLVLVKPARANARVAASRICSRRCARGSRRVGPTRLIVIADPLLFKPNCTTNLVYLRLYIPALLGGCGGHISPIAVADAQIPSTTARIAVSRRHSPGPHTGGP